MYVQNIHFHILPFRFAISLRFSSVTSPTHEILINMCLVNVAPWPKLLDTSLSRDLQFFVKFLIRSKCGKHLDL